MAIVILFVSELLYILNLSVCKLFTDATDFKSIYYHKLQKCVVM